MNKVLIVGSNNQIGINLLSKLSKNNYVYATYNKTKPNYKNKNVRYLRFDLLKPILKFKKFDILIFLASLTPKNKYKFIQYKIVNVNGLKNTLNIVDKKNLKKIILSSTTGIYGFDKQGVISEEFLSKKLSPYAKSKYLMEKILIKFCNQNSVKYSILRIPGIVGGKYYNNFLINLIRNIRENKNINAFNKNSKFNNVIHLKILCKIIVELINKNRSEILNVGSKNPVQIKNLINFIIKKINIKNKKRYNGEIKFLNSKKKSFYLQLTKLNASSKATITTKQTIEKILN